MANRNVDVLRHFAAEQDLKYFYDVGTPRYKGVCHIALPEEGHTRPGEVLLGTDSHTCTAGAFGEFATGIGNTDAGFVLGTGKLWLKVPPTMRFVFHGNLPPYLMAKDLILAVIGDIGCDGATYRAMEFDGDGLYALNIEERMTLCNMVIEAGGKNGVIAPDKVTLEYVDKRNAGQKPYTVFKSDPGAKIGPPSCAACLGGPSDTFGRLNGAISCISTTSRNFPGRMGDKRAQVFLASPLTVAASAVTGMIADPRDLLV